MVVLVPQVPGTPWAAVVAGGVLAFLAVCGGPFQRSDTRWRASVPTLQPCFSTSWVDPEVARDRLTG
jgi:hypothetical protein